MRQTGFNRYAIAYVVFCLTVLVGEMPTRALEAQAGQWQIVPGKRIGQVKLGMTDQALHHLLGSPQSRDRPDDKILVERWGTKTPSAKSAQLHFMADFITVYYRGDRVVQVDASSPAFKLKNGPSTLDSAQEFQSWYPPGAFRETNRQYHHRDPEGIPVTKHFVCYGDEVTQGLAWRYGWWGNLAPNGDSSLPLETISVHLPGHTVLADPDGTDLFTITAAYVRKHGFPKKHGSPLRKSGVGNVARHDTYSQVGPDRKRALPSGKENRWPACNIQSPSHPRR